MLLSQMLHVVELNFSIMLQIKRYLGEEILFYSLGLYDITHPEPVRILLHPNMNEYDTFLTHYGKAKKFYLNLWTVSQRENCPEKKILKIKLNYQLKHIVYVPLHRCFVAFAMDLTLRVYSTINFIEMSRTETNHSILCLYYNACRDDVLTGCLGK